MYKNDYIKPVQKAPQAGIKPEPAATATAPDKNPLHNDLTSNLGVYLLSPTTIYLLSIKQRIEQVPPETNVFKYASSVDCLY